ncbi:ADP-ribose pyrophosphatase [Sphaerotilus hippei]|uniref:GDP-mannose pyrophosphatase n=1 Tax=Sphaerotilus hippei TaxID=744406 RepID=A0A318GZE1_9BURK|nr:NUDIX hydrolase [Sphaerotilus hippei]PXW95518.1 ADP-ribose pyrophosphatase [Sphaerotilus hippei]
MSLPSHAELPAGEDHLLERPLSSRQAYRGSFLDVRRDEVTMPDGGVASREYIVHPGAVMVIPVLDDGRLVLERQFRYPLHRAVLEFPAGKLDAGEPGIVCAVRELQEETGITAREWAYACTLHNAIAYSTEGIEIWLARGLTLGAARLDQDEFLDVFTASLDEVAEWVRSGRITDAKTMIGLLWLQQWRAGTWELTWRSAEESLAAR